MAETILFKCPSCGGNLEFDPAKGHFVCPSCGSEFEESMLREESAKREEEAERKERAGSGNYKEYHCGNCGAAIVTEATTAATRCYYCHSPVVLHDRVAEDYRPDGVIPFHLEKEEARKQFDAYIARHHFVDRKFFSRAQLEDFSGVYYPYWIGEIEGEAEFMGTGHTSSSITTGREVITTTKYYRVNRAGRVSFTHLIRKALQKADRKLSDGIHPYHEEEMKPFASGYLSGFLAEMRDVEAQEAEQDMVRETEGYVEGLMTKGCTLSGLRGHTDFHPEPARMRYVLLPAWVLTYTEDVRKKVYYYMMNGQTGKICGKLPLQQGKLLLASGLLGAAVCGLLMAGGAFLW